MKTSQAKAEFVAKLKETRDKRTDEQQLDALDERLGEQLGARKERNRLLKRIALKNYKKGS